MPVHSVDNRLQRLPISRLVITRHKMNCVQYRQIFLLKETTKSWTPCRSLRRGMSRHVLQSRYWWGFQWTFFVCVHPSRWRQWIQPLASFERFAQPPMSGFSSIGSVRERKTSFQCAWWMKEWMKGYQYVRLRWCENLCCNLMQMRADVVSQLKNRCGGKHLTHDTGFSGSWSTTSIKYTFWYSYWGGIYSFQMSR